MDGQLAGWSLFCKDNTFLSVFIPELLGMDYGFFCLFLQRKLRIYISDYSCGTAEIISHHHDTCIARRFFTAPHQHSSRTLGKGHTGIIQGLLADKMQVLIVHEVYTYR